MGYVAVIGKSYINGGIVLVLKCAACKKKLWRYDKIGPGEVLRRHKDRIIKMYASIKGDNKIKCPCGKDIGSTHCQLRWSASQVLVQ